MGVRNASVASTTILNSGVIAQNAETGCVSTPPLNIPLDNAQVVIQWYLLLNIGPTTTGFRIRLRRGTGLGVGPVINVDAGGTPTPGVIWTFAGTYVDTPGISAGVQYTASALQGGATGAGTIYDVCMIAYVL